MSGNHPNRNGRSRMTRLSYEAMARRLRHYADLIEANIGRETPEQTRALTQTINALPGYTRRQYRRHNGVTGGLDDDAGE